MEKYSAREKTREEEQKEREEKQAKFESMKSTKWRKVKLGAMRNSALNRPVFTKGASQEKKASLVVEKGKLWFREKQLRKIWKRRGEPTQSLVKTNSSEWTEWVNSKRLPGNSKMAPKGKKKWSLPESLESSWFWPWKWRICLAYLRRVSDNFRR